MVAAFVFHISERIAMVSLRVGVGAGAEAEAGLVDDI
jgi:hypothetical protein